MSTPCPATMRVGCPDEPATLVCHRPSHGPGEDHYDAAEQVWWRPCTGDEPELHYDRPWGWLMDRIGVQRERLRKRQSAVSVPGQTGLWRAKR